MQPIGTWCGILVVLHNGDFQAVVRCSLKEVDGDGGCWWAKFDCVGC